MQRTVITLLAALLIATACTKQESGGDNASTDTGAATATTLTSPAGEASPPPPQDISAEDRQFAEKAARIGMAEVQLATNVSTRATSEEVKAFARRMIEEHNRSNQELTMIAAQKKIDPPADLDPEKKALDAELAKLNGPALDKRYMEAMVKSHVAAAAEFEAASRTLTDPDLKAWAAKNLPILHQHHHAAEEIAKKL